MHNKKASAVALAYVCHYQYAVEVRAMPAHIPYSTTCLRTQIWIFVSKKLFQNTQDISPVYVFIESLQTNQVRCGVCANKTALFSFLFIIRKIGTCFNI